MIFQKILLKNLNNLIIENNKYFQLLNDYEKQTLYKNFSDQFEFLNTHLLTNDDSFLKEYINLNVKNNPRDSLNSIEIYRTDDFTQKLSNKDVLNLMSYKSFSEKLQK
mgnify:CR=1 FL=1